MEITPFQVKHVNQTQQQNEGKNKLVSNTNNSFVQLFATYLSISPNAELGPIKKENTLNLQARVEEQKEILITQTMPLHSELIKTVESNFTNENSDKKLLIEEDKQSGIELLNFTSNQLVYQSFSPSQEEMLNLSKPESVNPLSNNVRLAFEPNVNDIDNLFISAMIEYGTEQEVMTTNSIKQNIDEVETQILSQLIGQETNQILNQKAAITNPALTEINSQQNLNEVELEGNNNVSQSISHANPTNNLEVELQEERLEMIQDNAAERVQNLSDSTLSKILSQEDTTKELSNKDLSIDENKRIILDKNLLTSHHLFNSPIHVQSRMQMTRTQSIPQSIHINDFVPELQKWMSNIKITNDHPSTTEARVSLFPKNLGHIEIKIMTVEGQLSAEIMTDTLQAKEVLEGQLPQLKQSLQQNGLVVQKIEILQQPVHQLNDQNQANLSFSQNGSNFSHEQRSNNNTKQASSNKGKDIELTELGDEGEVFSYGNTRKNSVSNIDFTA